MLVQGPDALEVYPLAQESNFRSYKDTPRQF
jgi:hypothetical protein